jgi:FixJ family two-component response regulator
MEGSEPAARVVNVAVVDDDASLCRSFARLLRAAGLRPVTYASAEAFLDDVQHPRFDCLLLDVQLGGMSGLELRRRLTAGKDSTPVIFITAQDDPELRKQALADGCAGFFRKTDPGRLVVDAIQKTAGNAGAQSPSADPAGGLRTPNGPETQRSDTRPL